MFNFFKKPRRLLTIEDHLVYLKENPNIVFQLDLIRNNQVDFQLFNQEVVKDFNIEVDNKSGYVLFMSFNNEKDNWELNHQRFKESNLFDKSEFVNIFGYTYVIKSNSLEEIGGYIKILINNIYCYERGITIKVDFAEKKL